MRPTRAFASCAVAMLAMVFSVQQGENGPLLLYKLHESDSDWIVATSAAPLTGEPVTHDFSPDDSMRTTAPMSWGPSLQAISDDLAWRRDTAEKLRQLPVGPRF